MSRNSHKKHVNIIFRTLLIFLQNSFLLMAERSRSSAFNLIHVDLILPMFNPPKKKIAYL